MIKDIPQNIQTYFLQETQSNVLPQIQREYNNIFFPVFVRQQTRTDEFSGQQQIFYRYFIVSIPYKGQDITDYERCKIQCYAQLRQYFYGDWKVQNQQQLKGTYASHQYAVKAEFPKFKGQSLQPINRFRVLYLQFWNTVDAACQQVGKTRQDLPQKFNSQQMVQWAVQNGMSQERISYYGQIFLTISVNLMQNGRNWDQLFIKANELTQNTQNQ